MHKPPPAAAAGSRDRQEYVRRVNRVIDYIQLHLAEELTLPRLAEVAAFSPFHFHRVFSAIAQETLFGFVQRLRLERAARVLLTQPDRSVLHVALDHGFASAATFARGFKAHFGMSATAWREGGWKKWRTLAGPPGSVCLVADPIDRKPSKALRKPSKALRKPGKAGRAASSQAGGVPETEIPMNIQIKELPAYHVAYLRYVGPYGTQGIPDTWNELYKWMRAHGLQSEQVVQLGIANDDPSITDPNKCRYDACVEVPEGFVADKVVNVADMPKSRCAVAEFIGPASEIRNAWTQLYGGWLPQSGFAPDDRPCFERYVGDPFVKDQPGIFRCELCVPVRPL